MRTLFALLLAAVLTLAARSAEPWLKKDDVVALVGGEDMVALAEEGWLETLVTWAQPKDRIRWRSLAWEGDTVFEQRRDLNYPTLETQLDKMGATVVLCQFGKMESFAGKEGVAAFTEAYEKLIARLSGEKKRRIALVLPPNFVPPLHGVALPLLPNLEPRNSLLTHYVDAIRAVAVKCGARLVDHDQAITRRSPVLFTRDGVHLDKDALHNFAQSLALSLGAIGVLTRQASTPPKIDDTEVEVELYLRFEETVRAKNRLWFHYTRPQNWAFLAGNRTNQPSSRDHKDPTKRWFPEEMEQWVPLIEAEEQEIWKLAEAPR